MTASLVLTILEIFTLYLQVRAGGRDAATAEETPPSMQEMCSGDG